MIYKVVAAISIIFLIIFGLVVYSALTMPAKNLVRVTSAVTQAISAQPSGSNLHPVTRAVAQLHYGSLEPALAWERRSQTGESLFIYDAYAQISSGQSSYTLIRIPPSVCFSNGCISLDITNQT